MVEGTDQFEFLTRDGSIQAAKKFMQELLPWYARENTLAALRIQGFNIESQTEENGEIVIVAGKWC